MKTKTCSKCRKELDVKGFNKKSERRDGLTSACRACNAEAHRMWRMANVDYAREKSRKWQADNRELANNRSAEWQRTGRRKTAETFAKSSIVRKRGQCKHSGLPFDLTWQWYVDRLNEGCAITKVRFDLGLRIAGERFRRHSPAIDRIDPTLGYVMGNCRLVTAAVNIARHCWGDEGLIALRRELMAWPRDYADTAYPSAPSKPSSRAGARRSATQSSSPSCGPLSDPL